MGISVKMGVLQVAFFTVVVLGAQGAPVDEPIQAWQNDTVNKTTTSTESDGRVTIFAPVTQQTQESLDMPENTKTATTYSPVFSPVTQVTQLSLEAPPPGQTGGGGGAVTWDTSVVIPVVTDTGSSQTTFITVAPSAHVEQSGSFLIIPGPGETITAQYPHVEISDSEIDHPPSKTVTDSPGPTDDGAGSATSTAHTEISGIELVIPGKTSDGDASPTQHDGQDSHDSNPTSNPSSGGENNNNDDANGSQGGAPSTFLIDNTQIVAGGSPITVSGNTISLSPSGSVLLNGDAIPMTTSNGHLLPVPTGSEADNDTYDSSKSGADESTSSEQTTESNGNGNDSARETSASTGADSTSTSTNTAGEAPATQTDNASSTINTSAWSATILTGVIGFLAAWL
ncbi:hypothetical protein Q7P37_004644 [Cladosporium fusiforme]